MCVALQDIFFSSAWLNMNTATDNENKYRTRAQCFLFSIKLSNLQLELMFCFVVFFLLFKAPLPNQRLEQLLNRIRFCAPPTTVTHTRRPLPHLFYIIRLFYLSLLAAGFYSLCDSCYVSFVLMYLSFFFFLLVQSP